MSVLRSSVVAIMVLLSVFTACNSFRMQKISANKLTRQSKINLNMRWGLEGPSANKPMGTLPDGKYLRDTVPFELRGFSLPLIVFSVGILLTLGSFAGYFINQDGGDDNAISSLGFVYGIPVFLIGLSLWYAEIPPVKVISDAKGDAAWDKLKTDTMEKIELDVTRHRYGDDAHLDSTLEALGLKLPQKKFPRMQTIIHEDIDGELGWTMTFQSLETPYKVWSDPDRVKRYDKFFGPGVRSEVLKIDADKRIVGLRLITTSQNDAISKNDLKVDSN